MAQGQITYTTATVEDIKGTLERQAATIDILMGVITRGDRISPATLSHLELSWGSDITECIKRLETEGWYV